MEAKNALSEGLELYKIVFANFPFESSLSKNFERLLTQEVFCLFLDMNILEDYYAICLEKILKRDLYLMI